MSSGYRAHVQPDNTLAPGLPHFCGTRADGEPADCPCPNCGESMFPALNIDIDRLDVDTRALWSGPMSVYVCPGCLLFMRPYFLHFDAATPRVEGGRSDGGEIIQRIERPYVCREIRLEQIQREEAPISEEVLSAYRARRIGEGVYHQVGGAPWRGRDLTPSCPACGSAMPFAGVVDYDDLNVPLYENDHQPVALIIGDMDSINFYACKSCRVIGCFWVRD